MSKTQTKKFSYEQIIEAQRLWTKKHRMNERFGQFFCNRFNITDDSLFYETDFRLASQRIWEQYSEDADRKL